MDISKSEALKNITVKQKNPKSETKNIAKHVAEKATSPTEKEIKNFSVKTLLDSLFKDLSSGTKSKSEVLSTLKQLDISLNIKDTVADLKALIQLIKSDESILKSDIKLDEMLLDIKNLTSDNLRAHIEKSGVFFESKLAEISFHEKINNIDLPALVRLKDEVFSDVKSVLLTIQDKLNNTNKPEAKEALVHVDKILTNIYYYQLLSFSANVNISYLPLLWTELEDGRIQLKKLKQSKYFCEINLKLKRYGKIDLLLMLSDDKYVDISFFAEDENLLQLLNQNIQALQNGISKIGLISLNMYIFDYLKGDKAKKDTKAFADSLQTGEGINIHV
ncbi:MAG: flagellar hook-length control protein FliK [Sulfurospirillaceae bacterium]|nr:flagellar hook-length control protein FliK [Sulfurospirillaceae bacterium]